MTFKECVTQDINSLFNADEVSEIVNLNSVQVIGVFSSAKVTPVSNNLRTALTTREGITSRARALRVRNVDLPKGCRIGGVIKVNNDSYIIDSIEPSINTTKLALSIMVSR